MNFVKTFTLIYLPLERVLLGIPDRIAALLIDTRPAYRT